MPHPFATALTLLATALPLLAQQSAPAPAAQAPARRAVLVTGASTGIGRKTTETLAANGFFVYAGARKAQDLKELNAIANVQALELDVTKQDQIDAAAKTVREAGRGLYAVINNAGVAVLGPMIELREEDLTFQLNVNLFGPYRVTKAFAPLLIESKGRVVTTGSLSGTVCWPMGGAYCISKHGVEAYTDTLAAELAPFGVQVSVVEPGNYKSEIFTNMKERLLQTGYTGEGSRYQKQMDRLLSQPLDRADNKEPDEVAATMLKALTDDKPHRRYLVVPNQKEADLTIRAAIARVVQLNQDQPYALDRDALIKLLDEALAKK